MEWIKRPIDSTRVRSVSARYGVDLLTASILVRRDLLSPSELRYCLENELLHMHNPFLFTEMDDAVERILQARDEGERIKICGDRDTDGITSTVIMKEALDEIGVETEWALPVGDEPYGLTMGTVEDFAARDGTLFITVDCGISNFLEIARAQELGIDTIIIDHHNPQEQLPPAHAIINPKVPECGYPFEGLAGCGVTAKVAWALLFARTPFYNQPVCLLNVRPANEAYVLEAAIVTNLVETDRITETLVPGMVGVDHTRLEAFLTGKAILVYDADPQRRMLQQVFGRDAEIHLTDIAPEVWQAIPEYSGKSLLRLKDREGLGKYAEGDVGELDVLVGLFAAHVYAREPSLSEGFASILDLVALGTLADLMPLRDENRLLVRNGLAVLERTTRPGLQELLARQNLYGKRISTSDIGWQISPLINATGRLGVPQKAARLFLSTDRLEQRELVEEIYRLNRERKKLGEDAWDRALPQARDSLERHNGRLVQVGGADIHRGVTGIIAARLAKFFNVPAFVVALLEDKAVGSARSVRNINVKELLDRCGDIFSDYGGHDYAAGYSMGLAQYAEFQDRIAKLSEGLEALGAPSEILNVDAEIPPQYMNPELVRVVERLEPYGEANPPLVFLLKGARILSLDLIGRKEQSHVRLLLDSGQYKWPAVFWNSADRVNRDFALNDRVDVVFRLGRNYYQGQESLQLTVLDIAR